MNDRRITQILGDLESRIEEAGSIDAGHIAIKVKETGFACRQCAECCKNSCGDNTVAVFPFEIRKIMGETGMDWLDIVNPPESEDIDDNGHIHTFEWVLRKKPDGDCLFLDGDGKCKIYEIRPYICRTYPMRLDEDGLETFVCKGLKCGMIDDVEALSIAKTLKDRYITELKETFSLFEKYDGSASSGPVTEDRIYVVHDSEGRRKVRMSEDGGTYFL
ncbi:YkgJ family cysteine cluster protein [Methanocella sp. CWC-04]|uniref:YkgJ family cysteine cluster protein n=1 Tax=Methanooceanicella nereidis TaxID=2052831 RepID=A0AAP2RHC4_9EURY|nr:YkgJ family cysteine cluster protein [Methanocella sp. CWC-04]MCD1296237.1 YkgJ family cysteine cluster protein [Methanocella sp. CWC-04]